MSVRSKKVLFYSTYPILSAIILLIVLEFIVRLLFPQINYQGNQMSLFVENKFHKTMGLKPNATGEFFGKEISTDDFGFRKMKIPQNFNESWLFLGDSVTFGVGVDTDKIFPQLIQNRFQTIRILNTALVGYSTINYLDIVETILPEHDDIRKIVLFFCLNDIYGNLNLTPNNISMKEKILSFLRSNSKLYMLLKKSFFDRSKTYALYDIGLYNDRNYNTERYLNAIVKIKSISDKYGIDFLVVILPYEYQLRMNGLKAPQQFLKDFLTKKSIHFIDLYDDFTLLNSEDYFLYGDPMHLSPVGHKAVAQKLSEILK